MANEHILSVETTGATFVADAEGKQRAILSDWDYAWSWLESTATNTYVGAVQGYTTNGTSFAAYSDNHMGQLTLHGDLLVSEYVKRSGGTDDYIRFQDGQLNFACTGTEYLRCQDTTQDIVLVGPGAQDIDFGVNNASGSRIFTVDAGDDSTTAAGNLILSSVPADTDNTVLVLKTGTGVVSSDEINSAVWDTSASFAVATLNAQYIPVADGAASLINSEIYQYGSGNAVTIGVNFGTGDPTFGGSHWTVGTDSGFAIQNSATGGAAYFAAHISSEPADGDPIGGYLIGTGSGKRGGLEWLSVGGLGVTTSMKIQLSGPDMNQNIVNWLYCGEGVGPNGWDNALVLNVPTGGSPEGVIYTGKDVNNVAYNPGSGGPKTLLISEDGHIYLNDPYGHGGVYGYTSGGFSALSLATSGTWVQMTTEIDTNQPNSGSITSDAANDRVNIGTAGDYNVDIAIDFSGSTSTTFQFCAAKGDPNTASNILLPVIATRSIGTASSIGSTNASGTVTLAGSSTVTLWARNTTGASKSATVYKASLRVESV